MKFNDNQPAFELLRNIISERTQEFVFWVGAGLSRPAGIPTWSELKTFLIKEGLKDAEAKEENQKNKIKRALEAAKEQDNWLAFNIIKENIGNTLFSELIRQKLMPKKDVKPPSLYGLLWSLRPKGMLTTNLDQFASASFYKLFDESLGEITGLEAGKKRSVLNSSLKYVVNLHGKISDAETWVLTQEQLTGLLSDKYYTESINSILSSKTVIFVGLTVDDVSTGGFIENMKKSGINLSTHYWVTEKNDTRLYKWGQDNSLQIINFDADENDYSALENLFKKIASYIPKDDIPKPIISDIGRKSYSITSLDEIVHKKPEEIRLELNEYALCLLTQNPPDIIGYENLLKDYDYPITMADYVSTDPPHNIIFGYEIDGIIGNGAFSEVYSAKKKNQCYALKKFRKNNISVEGMLPCFRRGVHSMKILSENKIDGVVPYIEAYEIPPCVLMEKIEGPNLFDAVQQNILEISDKLEIAYSIVKIIRSGHKLPQRVLHRDIRPHNIMLKDYYVNSGKIIVSVLDFDLSWHKEASGLSIRPEKMDSLNYHAPEQISDSIYSNKNALVDSYGLGMTLYYLFTGKEPNRDNALRDDYAKFLLTELTRNQFASWLSLSVRLARLVYSATKYKQVERIDMGQIENELYRLHAIVVKNKECVHMELFVDEIMCRSVGYDYNWCPDKLVASKKYASGFTIALRADEVANKIFVEIVWLSSGVTGGKKIGKFLSSLMGELKSIFKNDWRYDDSKCYWDTQRFEFFASLKPNRLPDRIDSVVSSITKASERIAYD